MRWDVLEREWTRKIGAKDHPPWRGAYTEKISAHKIKKKTSLVPQDQGLAPVLGECRKQLIALKTFVIIIIMVIIMVIIITYHYHYHLELRIFS